MTAAAAWLHRRGGPLALLETRPGSKASGPHAGWVCAFSRFPLAKLTNSHSQKGKVGGDKKKTGFLVPELSNSSPQCQTIRTPPAARREDGETCLQLCKIRLASPAAYFLPCFSLCSEWEKLLQAVSGHGKAGISARFTLTQLGWVHWKMAPSNQIHSAARKREAGPGLGG